MGKIAKPQRSKKHKKIKAIDPFYVGERPADINAFKFNRKPLHEEDQEFSRGAREIMKLKNDMKLKSGKKKRKRKPASDSDLMDQNENLGVMERGVTKPFKPAPDFKQRRGESDKSFMFRVDRETAAVIQKAKFEEKYNVEVDELDKKSTDDEKPKEVSHKKMRLKERKAKLADKKRQRKEDRFGGFAALKDDVAFGEVVHQPPTFKTKPKNPKIGPVTTNAGTRSLLLAKMFSGPSPSSAVCDEDKAKKHERLSMSQKVMLNEERLRVIQLYRDLKQQRNTQQS